jgi:hypothetical protein
MAAITVPVSLGELVDKITILDLKREFINDPIKRGHVQDELTALSTQYDTVLIECPIIGFYAKMLKDINRVIWIAQDYIREHPDDTTSCIQIIKDNDRRFRVKNKINVHSLLKEQKGYPHKRAVFIGHTESGDSITNIGIVRYLSTLYDQVRVLTKNGSISLVKHLYADDPTITVGDIRELQPSGPEISYGNAAVLREDYLTNYRKDHPGTDVIPVGAFSSRHFPLEFFYEEFYKAVDLNPDVRFVYNYIPRDPVIEAEIKTRFLPIDCAVGRAPYAFVHSKGVMPHLDLPIFTFSLAGDYYQSNHPWHGHWSPTDQILLPNFAKMLEDATEIHIEDSSFFVLCCYLDLKNVKRLVVYKSRRSNYYNISRYPHSNQPWEVVTEW